MGGGISSIPNKENKRIMDNNKNILSIDKVIGKGKYGNVHMIKYKLDNKEIDAALKILKLKDINEVKNLMELSNSKDCNKYILCIYDFFKLDTNLYIITEFIRGYDLGIIKRENIKLSDNDIIFIMKYLLEGLLYIHHNGIVHRDIKLENIVFCKDKKVFKYIDFGFSCKINTCSKNIVGTPYYTSPDILKRKYDNIEQSDIYSLGVVFYYLKHMKFPYLGKDIKELNSNILKNNILSESDNILIDNVINGMIGKNKKSIKELLSYI